MDKCQDNKNNDKILNFTENNNSDISKNDNYVSNLIDNKDDNNVNNNKNIYRNDNKEDKWDTDEDDNNNDDLIDTFNLNKTELYMKKQGLLIPQHSLYETHYVHCVKKKFKFVAKFY
jgi:hypothetical protein